MNTKLRIVGLTKRFGDFTALENLCLNINEGEFMTLLGPSGCGKSTTIRLIAGLERPDSGSIYIDDKLVSGQGTMVPPERRNMGMVFQSYAVWPHMSVFENVAFALRMKKVPNSTIKSRVREMLRLVNLEGLEQRYPTQLSGGQQQRVALARALASEPSILLLDEPLSNLDAKLRESMRFEIRAIQKRVGITTVYVTHSQEEALTMSDRIAVMRCGALLQVGTPFEIYNEPASKFVADFVGLANFFRGKVVGACDGYYDIQLGNGTMIRAIGRKDGQAAMTDVEVMVRPENIRLSSPDSGEKEGMNTLLGLVQRAAFSGGIAEYSVQVDACETPVRAQGDPSSMLNVGDRVLLSFDARATHIVPAADQ
mgnify:CR=1 FL=1